jgi:hypothetical protein
MQTRKKRCISSKCKKYVAEELRSYKKMRKTLKVSMTKELNSAEKKLNHKTLSDEERAETEATVKELVKNLKSINIWRKSKSQKKDSKFFMSGCKNIFCNPGCKDTNYESGSELPKYIQKVWKDNKKALKQMNKDRKEIFGDKTNVLVDDFYEKLKPSVVKKLKKEGAISGCGQVL